MTGNSGNFAGTPSLSADNKLQFDLPVAPSGDTYTLTVGADGNSTGVTATIKQVPTERTWTLKSWENNDIYGNTKTRWSGTSGDEEDDLMLTRASNTQINAYYANAKTYTIGTSQYKVLTCSPECTYDNKYVCSVSDADKAAISSCSYDGTTLSFRLAANETDGDRSPVIRIAPDDGSVNYYDLTIVQPYGRIWIENSSSTNRNVSFDSSSNKYTFPKSYKPSMGSAYTAYAQMYCNFDEFEYEVTKSSNSNWLNVGSVTDSGNGYKYISISCSSNNNTGSVRSATITIKIKNTNISTVINISQNK